MPVSPLPGTSSNDVLDVAMGVSPILDLSAATQTVVVLLKQQDSTGWAPPGFTTTMDAVLTAHGYAGDTAVGVAHGAEIGLDALIGINGVKTGAGNDVVVDSAAANYIDTGAGNDSIWLRDGGADTVFGGAGDDWFVQDTELAAGEVLDGGSGHDVLGLGLVGGGSEIPTPIVDLTTATIKNFEEIDLGGSEVRLTSQMLTSFERVSGYGNIYLADRGAVIEKGAVMFSTLQMADGGQLLDFSQATSQGDLIRGGNGNDSIIGGYTVEAGLGNDLVVGNAVGGYLNGGAGNDVLRAGAGSTYLTGGAGRDIVIGGAGDDALWISDSAELVRGEIYDGGAGTDTLQLASGDLRGIIVRNIEAVVGGDIGISTALFAKLSSVQATKLTFTDNAALNFKGGLSASTVQLANDGQFLSFTQGSVGQILGGAGDDTIVSGQYGAYPNAGGYGAVLGGAGNDRITLLHGGNAAGGAGDDVLGGGDSFSTLTGGTGRDLFVYTAALGISSNMNIITDFTRGFDRVDLSAIDANAARAGNNAFHYIGGAEFTGHAGELHVAHADGTTRLEGDTNGDAVVDFAIDLRGAEVGARDIVM